MGYLSFDSYIRRILKPIRAINVEDNEFSINLFAEDKMRHFLIRWIIVAIALIVTVYIVPGIDVTGNGVIAVLGMASSWVLSMPS